MPPAQLQTVLSRKLCAAATWLFLLLCRRRRSAAAPVPNKNICAEKSTRYPCHGWTHSLRSINDARACPTACWSSALVVSPAQWNNCCSAATREYSSVGISCLCFFEGVLMLSSSAWLCSDARLAIAQRASIRRVPFESSALVSKWPGLPAPDKLIVDRLSVCAKQTNLRCFPWVFSAMAILACGQGTWAKWRNGTSARIFSDSTEHQRNNSIFTSLLKCMQHIWLNPPLGLCCNWIPPLVQQALQKIEMIPVCLLVCLISCISWI